MRQRPQRFDVLHDRRHAFIAEVVSFAGLLVSLVIFMALAPPARASAPSDFDIVAAGGSRSIGSDYAWIHINTSGQAVFAVHRADTLTAAPLDTVAFTITTGQRDSLWQTIQDQGFFSLLPNYVGSSAHDGS